MREGGQEQNNDGGALDALKMMAGSGEPDAMLD
jgi:hypothetical protein